MRDIKLFRRPELITAFLDACKNEGHDVFITCTLRTPEEHAAVWAQGRELLRVVNLLRKAVNWAPISEEQNVVVTWNTNTLHFADPVSKLSNAFDFGLKDKRGSYITDGKVDLDLDKIPDYLECALIAEKLGMISGKDFKNSKGHLRPDLPHVQLPEELR